jgi:hypothetical protein
MSYLADVLLPDDAKIGTRIWWKVVKGSTTFFVELARAPSKGHGRVDVLWSSLVVDEHNSATAYDGFFFVFQIRSILV